MTLNEFRTHWAKHRDEYARLRAQMDAATLIDQMLGELEEVAADRSDELLTLTAAAAECGYSADHLGRLVRDKTLTNFGRRHAPRVRRGDLPRRVQRWTGPRNLHQTGYDPITDARSLRSR